MYVPYIQVLNLSQCSLAEAEERQEQPNVEKLYNILREQSAILHVLFHKLG